MIHMVRDQRRQKPGPVRVASEILPVSSCHSASGQIILLVSRELDFTEWNGEKGRRAMSWPL